MSARSMDVLSPRDSVVREYRTKRVILEIHDALAESARTATPYQIGLNPPPADPICCHPSRETGSPSKS